MVLFVSFCYIDDRSSSKESEEVSEAISLFENEAIRLKDKFNPKNAFYLGNIIPDWTVAQCNYNYERHQNQQKYFNLIDTWLSASNYDSQLYLRSFNIDHNKHIKLLQSNE